MFDRYCRVDNNAMLLEGLGSLYQKFRSAPGEFGIEASKVKALVLLTVSLITNN
ncbi:hypothetical protein RG47T_4476 [Mucilaginibacter polytrichastri]|uniref:Uncharacterized protein n=1 Tax=Mucilaginibacter polytrichastri TaxID=1302689 RepID=A0A1Q6A4R9_9SPHI|nr:hypothetical protein RG47T_4476 [Mucilaginibacter polytrichastri]